MDKVNPSGLSGMTVRQVCLSDFPRTLFSHDHVLSTADPETPALAANGIVYILFLAVFTTFFAYILWYTALEKTELSRLSFYVFLIPVFSMIFSSLIADENLSVWMIAAGFAAVLGVAVAQKE